MRVAVEAGKVEGELLTGSTLLLWLQLVLSPYTISGDLFVHAYLTQEMVILLQVTILWNKIKSSKTKNGVLAG